LDDAVFDRMQLHDHGADSAQDGGRRLQEDLLFCALDVHLETVDELDLLLVEDSSSVG